MTGNQLPAPVACKPLKWDETEENWHTAATVFNYGYEVRKTDRGAIRLRIGNGRFEDFDGSFEQAKAACQADFEARISSALATAPEGTGGPKP